VGLSVLESGCQSLLARCNVVHEEAGTCERHALGIACLSWGLLVVLPNYS